MMYEVVISFFLDKKKILAISYLCISAIVGVKLLNFCVRYGYR